ncbi:NAD-dependent histone deacetylase sir2 [Podila epicladia]|nr:NAD-dependent histone deacetylase sir2 [Podila epicladia]
MEPLPPNHGQTEPSQYSQKQQQLQHQQQQLQQQKQQQQQLQQPHPTQFHPPQHSHSSSSTSDDLDRSLLVTTDHQPLLSNSRPESPVSRKRTEEETLSHQDDHADHHPRQGGSTSTSLPPLKKSKKSPPLAPTLKELQSPHISPVAEHFLPLNTAANSASEPPSRKNTSDPVSGLTTPSKRLLSPGNNSQPKSMRMDGIRSTSPPFQRRGSDESRSLLESLSKSGEATLVAGVAKDPARVIISRPGSRQTSPLPDFGQTSHRTLAQHVESILDGPNLADPSDPAEGEAPQIYPSDSDDSYDNDSLDEIDVENIAMHDSELEDEAPYEDTDPLCLDRLSDAEEEIVLDEARMNGIGYVIRKYIFTGVYSAKKMLLMTTPSPIEISEDCTESDIIRVFSSQLKRLLRRRRRLSHVHTLETVIELLKSSKKIMILTGAGVSVSCGIPDFRSPNGIYSRLSEFELDEPQQMFDLEFFRERPEIFYSFAREIFPSNFTPSPSHYFIKLIEDQGRLLRNYTQNIDTLEQKAGIQNVLQCHGSFATASCIRCGTQVKGDDIKDSIFKQEVAYCKSCKTPSPPPKAKSKSKKRYSSSDEDESEEEDEDRLKGLMKPDIVFFGEKLPNAFDKSLKEDREQVDLLIVMGSSLKVAPVSDIMHSLPNSVPQILINRTPITHMDFDVQLLGDCDIIVAELCRMAGWELKHEKLPGGTSNVPDMAINTNLDGLGQGGRAHWSLIEPNTYLFEGAVLEDIGYEPAGGSYAQEQPLNSHEQPNDGEEVPSDAEGEEDENQLQEGELLGASKKRGRNEPEDGGVGDGMGSPVDEDSRRRQYSRTDRLGSVEPMSEDVVDFLGDHEGGHESEGLSGETAAPMSSGFEFPSWQTSSGLRSPTWQQASSSSSSGIKSPSWQQTPVGIAAGTTEPRSGSITEIHQDVLAGAHNVFAATGATRSGTSTPSSLPLLSPSLRPTIHSTEEEAKILSQYNEKMPKDLGEDEEGDEASDMPADLARHHSNPAHVSIGPHSLGLPALHRRMSAELVPISEDQQEQEILEVGEVEDTVLLQQVEPMDGDSPTQ